MIYAIIDIETTGGKYNEEGITEIAIYRFDGIQTTDRLVSLVNPDRPIQPFVKKLTGITDKMVRTAPKFYQLAKRILEVTKDAVIVAHNAKFDYRMLTLEYKRLGYDYRRNTTCTIELSRILIPNQPSYSLGKLTKELGIPIRNRHRAEGDVIATLKLFKILISKDTKKIIPRVSKSISVKKKLSTKYINILENLPNALGVYYIHDKSGDILYINKALNIKTKVTQDLLDNSKRGRFIQDFIENVSYEKTGCLIIAALKVSEEVEVLSPTLNSDEDKNKQRKKILSYPSKNFAIIDKGRTVDENVAILIKDGKLKGYAYYNLNHQFSIKILERRMTPIKNTNSTVSIIEKHIKETSNQNIVYL